MPFLGTTGGGSVRQYGGLAKLGYLLRNSLRFRASATAYLSRTGTTASNVKTATYSFWMKRGILSTGTQWLFTGGGSGAISLVGFNAGADTLSVLNSDTTAEGNITTAVFRDPAAWYHIVIRINTTEGSAVDRAKIYVNGVLQASPTTAGGIGLDATWNFNTAQTLNIGRYTGASGYSDLYLAEVYFIDGGTPPLPSAFAKTDPVTGQWIPIKYAGTYGNNGFYLNFNDISNTTAATLGKDSSGNGNNWTPNNFSITSGATYDPVIDVPTVGGSASNYCVMNPLDAQGTATLTDGNLTIASAGATHRNRKATFMLPSTGKWYWELTTTATCSVSVILGWGLQTTAAPTNSSAGETGSFMAQNDANQDIWNQGTNVISTGSAVAANAIRQVAYDAGTGKLWFGINNVWYSSADLTSGNPSAGTNECITLSAGDYFPAITPYNMTANVNFGQQPFSYTPPTGFKSLNTYNLP
jgi:hypothetical protein